MTTTPALATHPTSLLILPQELLHQILVNLDTPDLLQVSRTSHQLRSLSLDPVLHTTRRQIASLNLAHALTHRPTRASLCPPHAWIWLSNTNVLSRSISRSLVKIRLAHCLEKRPGPEELVRRAILPESCCVSRRGGSRGGGEEKSIVVVMVSPVIVRLAEDVRKRRLRDKLGRKLERRPNLKDLVELNIIPRECAGCCTGGGQRVSPRLVATRRKIIQERLKDGLRRLVEKRVAIMEQRRKEDEQTLSVKALVRKMTMRDLRDEKQRFCSRSPAVHLKQIEGGMKEGCQQPTRANVLRLRRFWEGVIKTANR